jgi:outer membrane receptor protein involved in Fe transport
MKKYFVAPIKAGCFRESSISSPRRRRSPSKGTCPGSTELIIPKWQTLPAGVYYHYKGSYFVYTNEERQTTKKIPDYYTVELKFWRNIFVKNLTASFTSQNVFDKRDLESDTDLSPGRLIFGELGYRF